MQILSRRAFARLALAAPVASWQLPALAQSGGATGKLLVGYPPGGTLDTTSRHLVEAWRRQGRTYIVENRAGAAGRIANSQLKREKSDGSALLCTHASALTIFPHVYAKLAYDPVADFVPVSPVVTATCAFAVGPAVPANVQKLEDYLAWVGRTPAGASYASPAAGSMAHFLGFQFAEAGQVKLQHVGYRGSGPALQDLLGGQIPAYFGFVADFLPHLQTGRIRILGAASEQRSPFMRGVPTFAEQGFRKIQGSETYGVFAPPGVPESTLQALHESVVVASRDPALRSAYEQVGLEPFTQAPADYARQIQRDRETWGPVVRASGFRMEE